MSHMDIAYVRGICMMSRFWSTHLFLKFRIFEFSKNGDFDMKSRPFLARVFPEFSYIVAALKNVQIWKVLVPFVISMVHFVVLILFKFVAEYHSVKGSI